MTKTLQEALTDFNNALTDLFNVVADELRLRDLVKWLDDKLKKLNYK